MRGSLHSVVQRVDGRPEAGPLGLDRSGPGELAGCRVGRGDLGLGGGSPEVSMSGASLRLRGFSVENFRSIRDALRFDDVGALEVLHGANNAGKSNLLRALDLVFRVLVDNAASVGDRPTEYKASELRLPPGPIAHRDRAAAPTVLGLSLDVGGEPLELGFSVEWLDPGFGVSLTHARRAGQDVALNATDPLWEQLSVPARCCTMVPPGMVPPDGWDTWDAWLLDAYDRDATGAARRRHGLVERALRAFEAELGPGRLDRIWVGPKSGGRLELAWQGEDGVPVPFSEQGSGLQRLKDIAVAVFGTADPVVVVEQPEDHLSESAQDRLFEMLQQVVAGGRKQVIVSSHVYAFDGPQSRRVVKVDGGTQLVDRAPVAVGPAPDAGCGVEDWSRYLRRLHAQAELPSAGWVAESGLVQLPASVRASMELPTVLAFSRIPSGGVLAVPVGLIQRWSDEGEE